MGRATYESIGRPLPGPDHHRADPRPGLARRRRRGRARPRRGPGPAPTASPGDVMVAGGGAGVRRGAAGRRRAGAVRGATSSRTATSATPTGPGRLARDPARAPRGLRPGLVVPIRLALTPWTCGSSPSPSRAPPTTTCSPWPGPPRSSASTRSSGPTTTSAMGTDGLPGPTDAWMTLAGLARETSTIRLGTLMTSRDLPPARAAGDPGGAGRPDERRPGRARARRRLVRATSTRRTASRSRTRRALRPARGAARDRHRAVGDPGGRDVHATTASTTRSPTHRRCPSRSRARDRRSSSAAWASGVRRRSRRATPTSSTCRSSSEDDTRTQFDRVRKACEDAGRDPDDADLLERADRLRAAPTRPSWRRRAEAIGRDVADLRANGLAGTPDEVVDRLGPVRRARQPARLPADARPGRPRPPRADRRRGHAAGLSVVGGNRSRATQSGAVDASRTSSRRSCRISREAQHDAVQLADESNSPGARALRTPNARWSPEMEPVHAGGRRPAGRREQLAVVARTWLENEPGAAARRDPARPGLGHAGWSAHVEQRTKTGHRAQPGRRPAGGDVAAWPTCAAMNGTDTCCEAGANGMVPSTCATALPRIIRRTARPVTALDPHRRLAA